MLPDITTEAWSVIGETYLVTIVVSFIVAFLVHMMTLLVGRFGSAAKPLPAPDLVGAMEPPDDPEELAALAVAVALRSRHSEGR